MSHKSKKHCWIDQVKPKLHQGAGKVVIISHVGGSAGVSGFEKIFVQHTELQTRNKANSMKPKSKEKK